MMKSIISFTLLLFGLNFSICQTNIAIGKSTSQSSTHATGYSSKAVDGVIQGSWGGEFPITHTEQETNPWWKIDMGTIYNIGQIVIYNRVDCCSERLAGAKVYAGYNDSSNPNDYTLITQSLTAGAQQQINLNINARYILVYLEGTNKILSLDEFEIYGDLPNSNVWLQSVTGIYSTNNVGIGGSNPDEKLAVNGNIHTKEVRVDLVGWSDFVFDKNYNLSTLKEVEQHIKLKGHLKDIPSAKEVAEKGILLGDMNAKLLQKIEELTLYTIQQQKLIEEQSKAIEELQELVKTK